MADYEITITRSERNPEYQPPRMSLDYGHGYDTRTPDQQREFNERRVVTATLTDAEYEAVKKALVIHWAQDGTR